LITSDEKALSSTDANSPLLAFLWFAEPRVSPDSPVFTDVALTCWGSLQNADRFAGLFNCVEFFDIELLPNLL